MRRLKRHPILKELLIQAYNGESRLMTRTISALSWVPHRRAHMYEIAEDRVLVAALYNLDKKSLYKIRNIGEATIEPLFTFLHSEEGKAFFDEYGIGDGDIQSEAKRLIKNEIR